MLNDDNNDDEHPLKKGKVSQVRYVRVSASRRKGRRQTTATDITATTPQLFPPPPMNTVHVPQEPLATPSSSSRVSLSRPIVFPSSDFDYDLSSNVANSDPVYEHNMANETVMERTRLPRIRVSFPAGA